MKAFCCFFSLILFSTYTYAQISAPTALTAAWINDAGTRKVSLGWSINSSTQTGWDIQRKIGTGAWANLTGASSLGSSSASYVDAVTTATVLTYYHYRVRAKNTSATSGWAEVSTAGIPSAWPADNYDSDADGLTDAAELAAGLNRYDWMDGTGDMDGDLIPNAWESGAFNTFSTLTPDVTVDPSYTGTDTATLTKTITGAIAKLAGANLNTPPFRVILVKPGVYKENIVYDKDIHLALIADRSGSNPKKECEIQGVTNSPVITAEGSLVLDGFVLTRAPGTLGPAFSWGQVDLPRTRIYLGRMTNCIVRNMDVGNDAVIKQTRGMLVVSHCTFVGIKVGAESLATSYITGPSSGSPVLESTARVKIWNSVFWSPINTTGRELQSVGDWAITSSIFFGQSLPGTSQVNPQLTPKGYLLNGYSIAATGGTVGAHVLMDIHGEVRFDPPGRGADDWYDFDQDKIPDFADTQPTNVANAAFDLDHDLLTEFGEYQAGTSVEFGDTDYLTLDQALRIFSTADDRLDDVLTKSEAAALYMPLNPSSLRKVRVAPGGDIDMGDFD